MKFSAQEEYGLRCLIRIGRYYHLRRALTIPEISQFERISQHTVAKLLRILRLGNILESERGQSGGYALSRAPEKISIGEVLAVLGGRLYDDKFCKNHSGLPSICTNTIDCSIRSLWTVIQDTVDHVVDNLTLKDLLGTENALFDKLNGNYSSMLSEDKPINF